MIGAYIFAFVVGTAFGVVVTALIAGGNRHRDDDGE